MRKTLDLSAERRFNPFNAQNRPELWTIKLLRQRQRPHRPRPLPIHRNPRHPMNYFQRRKLLLKVRLLKKFGPRLARSLNGLATSSSGAGDGPGMTACQKCLTFLLRPLRFLWFRLKLAVLPRLAGLTARLLFAAAFSRWENRARRFSTGFCRTKPLKPPAINPMRRN